MPRRKAEPSEVTVKYQAKPGTTAVVFEFGEIRPYAIRHYGDPVAIDLSPDSD